MAKGSVRKKGKKWYYRFYVEDESGENGTAQKPSAIRHTLQAELLQDRKRERSQLLRGLQPAEIRKDSRGLQGVVLCMSQTGRRIRKCKHGRHYV